MNFNLTLLLLIVCFESISTSAVDVPGDVSSEKHSPSFGNLFQNIGANWKKAKKKSAERKFSEQMERRKRLEEAAQLKADKLRKEYNSSSRTHLKDFTVIQKLTLKKGYHKWLDWRATKAESELEILKQKYASEEYCDFSKKDHKNKKKKEVTDVCKLAFKNPYFQKEKLTYNENSPYACQDGTVFVEDTSAAETLKYPTEFKTCVATKEESGSKSKVSVFIKKSDKQRKGGKMKFFVFFAEENDASGKIQYLKNLLNGETTIYKVAAYLKNSWF